MNSINPSKNMTAPMTKNSRNKNSSSGRPSLFSHKIITKKDITLLPRGKKSTALSSSNQSHDSDMEVVDEKGNCPAKSLKPLKYIIVDSIPPTESNLSDVETIQSQDPDVLFSPYYDSFDRDDFFEEEIYTNNNNILYGKNNSFSSLKKFQENQTASTVAPATVDITNTDSYPLGLPIQLFEEIKDEDFWKEVKGTNEDIIPIDVDYYNNDDIKSSKRSSVMSHNMDSSSIENYLSDEYLTTSSINGSNYASAMSTDIPQYNIRLLCYRDADGNLALKTTNQLKSNCNNTTSFISHDPTGLAGCKRINKKGALLQKAIRRKSGFREMILTGAEMNEFML